MLPSIDIFRCAVRANRIDVILTASLFSPNAEEALSLLSIPIVQPIAKLTVEEAAQKFLELGAKNAVIIRCGALGAYVLTREGGGKWIEAYWTKDDASRIVDVTGAKLPWSIL